MQQPIVVIQQKDYFSYKAGMWLVDNPEYLFGICLVLLIGILILRRIER